MAHVLIYEELCHVLGATLRTNSLPERMPGFEILAALALSGSRFAEDRTTLDVLNKARNEVAHRTNRSKFGDGARQFARHSCEDKNYTLAGFEWPTDEKKKIENFRFGFFVWQAKLGDLKVNSTPIPDDRSTF